MSVSRSRRCVYSAPAGGASPRIPILSRPVQRSSAGSGSETQRYQGYYGIDWLDPHHYDLVVDTSELSVSAVVAEVAAFISAR